MDEIDALIERAEKLRSAPNAGMWGAVVKANMLAAARKLKEYPRTYWADHPKEYAEAVEMLRRGVRFLEHIS